MYSRKIAWNILNREEIEAFARDYINFINAAKTEREVVDALVNYATKRNFKKLEEVTSIKPGDRVYSTFKNKTAIFAVIGRKSLKDGVRLIAAHGDSPRLDPKPLPIMEDADAQLGLLNIGFYGGIVTYHWVNIPLELRGIVATKKGIKKIRIPNLIITDLLPHLSKKKFAERKGSEVVKGEELKILIANIPVKEEQGYSWKSHVLKILAEKYDIEEEDFISADLEIVPALEAREIGFDSSMIAAYGHDDRVCVYTGFRAFIDLEETEYTRVFWVVDKEEIGSEANTSAQSEFFKYFIAKLLELSGEYSEIAFRECLLKTKAVSADVTAVINPVFKSEIYDVDNAARMGSGVVLEKYSSAAGKSGANEAHAEFIAWLRKILDERNIPWQPGLFISKAEKGIGGGGTISKFMARMGMDVVDMGVGLLGMHSPYEVASKADIFSAYKAYKAFYEKS